MGPLALKLIFNGSAAVISWGTSEFVKSVYTDQGKEAPTWLAYLVPRAAGACRDYDVRPLRERGVQ